MAALYKIGKSGTVWHAACMLGQGATIYGPSTAQLGTSESMPSKHVVSICSMPGTAWYIRWFCICESISTVKAELGCEMEAATEEMEAKTWYKCTCKQ